LRVFLFIIGLIILVFTVIDLIWSTLWVDKGAGPITGFMSTRLWKLMRRMSGNNDRFLSLAGPLILVITLLVWILLMWVGWTLVFTLEPDSISSTMHGGEASWYERIYFVGYSLFTLGNGNYAPKTGVWQIVSAFVSGGGMLFLTLGASYIISVVDAVVKKRAFASSIAGLSKNPTTIIKKSWNGEDFNRLDLLLVNLSSDLSLSTQEHKAYPLLHYYHSSKEEETAAAAVAVLDETLTMMEFGVEEEIHPNPVLQGSIRESIATYLETLDFDLISEANQVPPIPDLEPLREEGIPVVSDEEFEKSVSQIREHRKKLYGLVIADGREWPMDV